MPLRKLVQIFVNVKNRCLKHSSEPRYTLLKDEEKDESEAREVERKEKKKEGRNHSQSQDFVVNVENHSLQRRRDEWEIMMKLLYDYNLI